MALWVAAGWSLGEAMGPQGGQRQRPLATRRHPSDLVSPRRKHRWQWLSASDFLQQPPRTMGGSAALRGSAEEDVVAAVETTGLGRPAVHVGVP